MREEQKLRLEELRAIESPTDEEKIQLDELIALEAEVAGQVTSAVDATNEVAAEEPVSGETTTDEAPVA